MYKQNLTTYFSTNHNRRLMDTPGAYDAVDKLLKSMRYPRIRIINDATKSR